MPRQRQCSLLGRRKDGRGHLGAPVGSIRYFFTGDGSAVDTLEVTLLTVPATDTVGAQGPTLSLANPIALAPTSGNDLELIVDGNDVFVGIVPAPGAAALLGLAGVAGIRRRRA